MQIPKKASAFYILMIQDKLLGSGMEAQIKHRRKGKNTACSKYQIQGKNIAKKSVNYRRKCRAANGSRLDEA